jgi:hypothetical protein
MLQKAPEDKFVTQMLTIAIHKHSNAFICFLRKHVIDLFHLHAVRRLSVYFEYDVPGPQSGKMGG